jgi:hypothetical protein
MFSWGAILQRKEALARELDADWFIHHDADEFRESPWPGLTLREAIGVVDRLGFDAIDFEVFTFWPTRNGFNAGDDLWTAFPCYTPPASHDRLQIKCWKKQSQAIDLRSTGGHEAIYDGRRVFPVRFLLRHYPIRSQAHGERKVFGERVPRFTEEERHLGWHRQYEGYAPGATFLKSPAELQRYDADRARLHVHVQHRPLEAAEAELSARRRETSRLEQALQEARAALESSRAEFEATRVLHDRERADREGIASRLEAREAEVSGLRAARACDARDLAEARAALGALLGEREARDAVIAALESRLADEAAEQERRGADAARLLEATRAAASRVTDLEASRSWRWTAPLRAVYRLLFER